MNKTFKVFVESDLVNFMETYKLEDISVKDSLGNKAKIKRNKDGLLISDITTTTVL
ncbi:MAG TPA: hypothetical protein VFD17_07135 [Clostridia bacterium]|nr:hypothetical protein [Clostridia bacterium]